MPVNSVEALKSRFNQALRDGRVSSYEAQGLIALVKDGGGVTNSERRQLRELFYGSESRFEATGRATLDDFIKNKIPALLIDDAVIDTNVSGRRDLVDPPALSKDTMVKFDWVTGQLFKNGPDEGDVVQGMIGDCYLMAGFAAIADQNPDVITRAIRDNRDGTYTVTFTTPSAWAYKTGTRAGQKVSVTVDGELPLSYGGLRYGKGMDRNELWVPILEKAFAQWFGSYDKLVSGNAGAVMSALTGRTNTSMPVNESTNMDNTWNLVKRALDSGTAACAGTAGDEEEDRYKGTGMYTDHAYTILDAVIENGKKYFVMRNPWGEVEPRGNGADDGIFKLDLETFQSLLTDVKLC